MKKPPLALQSAHEKTQPLCKTAFPGFELDFQLRDGFKDTSWHQNETPSFDKVQPDGTVLRLWVDHAYRALSRLTDEVPYFRFALARYTGDDEWITNLGFAETPEEAFRLVAGYDLMAQKPHEGA